MSAMREKGQADFDLERFVDMFDEAMTSTDPRVVETLRKLMMIVAMTRPEDRYQFTERKTGPLRQMYDDVRVAHRRISDLEDKFDMVIRQQQMAESAIAWGDEKYINKASGQLAQHINQTALNKTMAMHQVKGLLEK